MTKTFKVIFGQKRTFLVKNGPKMGKKFFSQNFHLANILIDHKCSKNPMTGFGEIDQNVRFWAKMGYF